MDDTLKKLTSYLACKDSRLACAAAVIVTELAPRDPATVKALTDARFVEFDAEQFNYWGSLGVSAAYVGLVMLFCQSGAAAWLKHALRSVGQMAFTNYLMQSVICTTIFYGHGLGHFGHFSRVEMLLTVIAVWIAQLIYSPLWLARFQYGPFEWLWRSLTYWKMQPMLRPQVR